MAIGQPAWAGALLRPLTQYLKPCPSFPALHVSCACSNPKLDFMNRCQIGVMSLPFKPAWTQHAVQLSIAARQPSGSYRLRAQITCKLLALLIMVTSAGWTHHIESIQFHSASPVSMRHRTLMLLLRVNVGRHSICINKATQ